MSLDYANGLSHCDDLGICGIDEVFDEPSLVGQKVKLLADWLREYAGSCVVHVGAGLSTAAGIPDFRGKRGVWTERLHRESQPSPPGVTTSGSLVAPRRSQALAFASPIGNNNNNNSNNAGSNTCQPTNHRRVKREEGRHQEDGANCDAGGEEKAPQSLRQEPAPTPACKRQRRRSSRRDPASVENANHGRNTTTKHQPADVGTSSAACKPFDETEPTLGHLVLKGLCEAGFVRHLISQNVDGLFLKSNLRRHFISELHGNFYLDECTRCRWRFIRNEASKTMRLTRSAVRCLRNAATFLVANGNGDDYDDDDYDDNDNKPSNIKLEAGKSQHEQQTSNPPAPAATCSGYLRDTILDWESSLPINELRTARREAKLGKLHLAIGTSLQLSPSRDLVATSAKGAAAAAKSKRSSAARRRKRTTSPAAAASTNRRQLPTRLVIINLQPTKFDDKADLVIHHYADEVLRSLARELDLSIPAYLPEEDPTRRPELAGTSWTK